MKGRKKKLYFALVIIVFILTLYVVNEYLTTLKSYINGFNILYSKLTENDSIQGHSIEVVSDNNSGSHKIIYSTKEKIQITQDKTTVSNFVSIATIKQLKEVEHMRTTSKNQNKSAIFVDMRDIEKTAENIFFLETKCSTENQSKSYENNKGCILNARQCCAVESTALANPDRKVYIFHSCPLSDDFLDYSSKFVKRLFNYTNVHVLRSNMTEAFKDSPVQELYEKRILEASDYPIEHTSDVLRLAMLWKFGGTYCDLDVVTIRSFKNLKTNCAGVQDTHSISNGVINFEPAGPGHNILERMLKHVNRHFNGTSWEANGPSLITYIILDECNVSDVIDAMKECHGNFKLYKPDIFFPVDYHITQDLFKDALGELIFQKAKRVAYSVHIYNKISSNMQIQVGSKQAYALLADEFCPQVYHSCGSTF